MLPAGLSPLLPIRAVADTFRSVGRGVGGVMPAWGSSKAACLKEGSGCLGQNGSGQAAGNRNFRPDRLLGTGISDALTQFQRCLGLHL